MYRRVRAAGRRDRSHIIMIEIGRDWKGAQSNYVLFFLILQNIVKAKKYETKPLENDVAPQQ
jgi:hypothetical protein